MTSLTSNIKSAIAKITVKGISPLVDVFQRLGYVQTDCAEPVVYEVKVDLNDSVAILKLAINCIDNSLDYVSNSTRESYMNNFEGELGYFRDSEDLADFIKDPESPYLLNFDSERNNSPLEFPLILTNDDFLCDIDEYFNIVSDNDIFLNVEDLDEYLCYEIESPIGIAGWGEAIYASAYNDHKVHFICPQCGEITYVLLKCEHTMNLLSDKIVLCGDCDVEITNYSPLMRQLLDIEPLEDFEFKEIELDEILEWQIECICNYE